MKKIIIKVVAFVLIFAVLFAGVQRIFTAKFVDNNCQSYTAGELYELEKNSVEVILSGSSQAVFCVNGMEMYEKYGISTYGTGSPNQDILLSLGWLRELHKFNRDSLKVAVLDISQLYEHVNESFFRQGLDTMKLSKNKVKTAQQHIDYFAAPDPLMTYIFPIMKYHTRWDSLTTTDFTFSLKDSPMFRGNRLGDYVYSFDSYEQMVDDEASMEPKPSMIQYQISGLKRYVNYCKKYGIEVVLIKTPKEDWGEVKDSETQALADELGVPYLSFATKEASEQLGIDYSCDFKDQSHTNVRGADKIADALGAYLKEHYDLTDYRETNPYSEEFMDRYHAAHEQAYFDTCGDVAEYLNAVADTLMPTEEVNVIVELTDDSICDAWTDEMQAAYERLGFTTDIRSLKGTAYNAAAYADGTVMETAEPVEHLITPITVPDGSKFELHSIPNGNSSSFATIYRGANPFVLQGKGLNLYLHSSAYGQLDIPVVSLGSNGTLYLLRPHEARHQ